MASGDHKAGLPIYWGCAFTHSVPFLMQTVNAVLDRLAVAHHDVEDWSCCPDPVYVRAYGPDLHLALAARNLGLARPEKGKTKDLLVVCNGCYNTLAGAEKKLKDPKTRDGVNDTLGADRLEGIVHVKHFLELLAEKAPELRQLAKESLAGLRIAPYYGCHALRPPAVAGDDPEDPQSLHTVISALGAEPVDYRHMLDCCGIPTQGFSPAESEKLLEDKLVDLAGRADAIVTPCPSCFTQFDRVPRRIKDYALPVLHVGELVALALGATPEELHLEMHATKATRLLDAIEANRAREKAKAKVYELIPKNKLIDHCGACRRECAMAVESRDTDCHFDPLDIVDILLSGNLEKALADPRIWQCLQCGACETRCPQNRGLKDLFETLREEAVKRNVPDAVAHNVELVKTTGYAQRPNDFVRKRLGMAPAPKGNVKAIDTIIKTIEKKAKGKKPPKK